MHHILGPGGRWLLTGRGFSERPDASGGRCTAWQRAGCASISRRSSYSRSGRNSGCQAPEARRCRVAGKDPYAAHLLCRCAAVACGASGACGSREMARRATADISHWPDRDQRASSARFQLGPEACLRCDRNHAGQRGARCVGAEGESPRWLGEWRGGSDFGPGGSA